MRDRLPHLVIILTVAINSLGIGLIIPVMPDLLLEMGMPSMAEAAYGPQFETLNRMPCACVPD